MKNNIRLILAPILVMLFLVSCTKEGASGPAGTNGTDGTNGEDGTAGCVQCHAEDEDMTLKSMEWKVSAHASGNAMGADSYPGAKEGCLDCHSSQGFQHIADTGESGVLEEKALPANCYTCHKIHETHTIADWDLRKGEGNPVTLRLGGHVSDNGAANTCAECHQSREVDNIPVYPNDEHYEFGSKYWGTHYATQGNMMVGLSGAGAVEIEGSMGYTNSAHVGTTDCTSCHMASSKGSYSMGGHSNNVSTGSWDEPGSYGAPYTKVINSNGCISCHKEYTDDAGITGFVYGFREGEDGSKTLLYKLKDELMMRGLIDDHGYVIPGLDVSGSIASIVLNFKLVYHDGSYMVHNPKYSKALISNSYDALMLIPHTPTDS